MTTGQDNIVGNYRVDTFLTNYSEKFIQSAESYIAGKAATMVPVNAQSGQFATFDRSFWLRDEMEPRPHGGAPVQATQGVGRKSYAIDEYALEFYVDDRQRAAVSGGDDGRIYSQSDFSAVEFLTQKALLRRDRMWSTSFFKPSVWNYEYAGVAATPTASQFLAWDNTGANPIADVDKWKRQIQLATGMRPNTLVLGVDVIDRLRTNAYIQGLLPVTSVRVVTEQVLANLFDVDNVVVAQSIYNSAAENVSPTASANYQWNVPSNAMWLGYIAPTAALNTPTAILGLQWSGLMSQLGGAGVSNYGFVVRRGRDDRAASDWFHVHDAIEFKAASPELGVYATAVVTASA